jgi:hypothetical protein
MEYEAKFVTPLQARLFQSKNIQVTDNSVQIESMIADQIVGACSEPNGIDRKGRRDRELNRVCPIQNCKFALGNGSTAHIDRAIKLRLIEQIRANFDSGVKPNLVSRGYPSMIDENLCSVLRPTAGRLRGILLPWPMRDIQVGAQLSFGSFVGQLDCFSCGRGLLLNGIINFFHLPQLAMENASLIESAYSGDGSSNKGEEQQPGIKFIIAVALGCIGIVFNRIGVWQFVFSPKRIYYDAFYLGLILVGFVLTVFGFVWALDLNFSAPLNRSTENVIAKAVIIAELKFSDVQRHNTWR